jgi:S1-C subfamily serine protease
MPGSAASIQIFTLDREKTCTTFSVNEAEGYWLTANHCWQDGAELGIAGIPARVVAWDEETDLLLLRSQVTAVALVPGDMPREGDAVKAVGFPNVFLESVALFGFVSRTSFTVPAGAGDIAGDVMLTTACGAKGMSGAPIFVRDRVVGMMRGGLTRPCLDMVAPIKVLKSFLGLRWAYEDGRG